MTEEQAREIISPIGGGGSGDGFLPAYIVGETPYADDWLSDEVGGDPLTPEEGLLYLILTHGDYYSGFYRYVEADDEYILVGNARIKELTKQEYYALSENERNDGTVYFITDEAGPQPIDLPDRGFTPVGTIIAVMGVTAPEHYLACNGQVVSIAAYPELAAYFEEQFGAADHFGGDGTTTFGIPDLRGEFLRGTGTNSHAENGDGAAVGEHQDATKHTDVTSGSSSAANYIGVKRQPSGETTYTLNTDWIDTRTASNLYFKNATIDTDSSRSYYTSRPTNTSVLYCIAVKDIYVYSIDVSKGGHDIKDNGVEVPSRDAINFTDFDIADDSMNLETDIKAHRLTQAEMSEIMSTLPGTPTELPVMFDETGAERVVGWYRTSAGKKPVYETDYIISVASATTPVEFTFNTDADFVLDVFAVLKSSYNDGSGNDYTLFLNHSEGQNYINIATRIGSHKAIIARNLGWSGTAHITIRYTKTTDTPV